MAIGDRLRRLASSFEAKMQDLDRFERDLASLIGKPTELRPFVCNGSPLECGVFIVGFNPATASAKDFWTYWRSGFGFDKDAWFEDYLKERRERPLAPGKTRRNAVSNTRRNIQWVLEEVGSIRCLETNIHSLPTARQSDIAAHQRSTAPIDFLIRTVRPRLIVAHGNHATAHIEAFSAESRVIAVPHFSRGWSRAGAGDLGRRIAHEFGLA